MRVVCIAERTAFKQRSKFKSFRALRRITCAAGGVKDTLSFPAIFHVRVWRDICAALAASLHKDVIIKILCIICKLFALHACIFSLL